VVAGIILYHDERTTSISSNLLFVALCTMFLHSDPEMFRTSRNAESTKTLLEIVKYLSSFIGCHHSQLITKSMQDSRSGSALDE
jgi:hypothetical protein